MSSKKKYPLVSICTPTYNRRPFLPTMMECFYNQTYPRHRMEWIIVDDGTDSVEDVFKAANIPEVQYFRVTKKMTLGAKRNLMHKKCKGSIIVYMDDDDYYPPERVSHAVEVLQNNPTALCAGSSEIYIYFNHMSKMYQAGPYGANHATAGTFAFRKELLLQTKYNENASLAEEKEFLKNYTVPFVQLDPLKTILVFSHSQNTYDKKELLQMPNNLFLESNKTIEMFIKLSSEERIKNFFLRDMENKLNAYKHGDPIMKPDVLKQMKELKAEREAMQQQMQQQQMNSGGGQIMMQRPGEEPRQIHPQELVELIQAQQSENKKLNERLELLTKTHEAELLQRALKITQLENIIKTIGTSTPQQPQQPQQSMSKVKPEVYVELPT